MTEYVDLHPEPTDDPDVMVLLTNLSLTPGGEAEVYHSPDEGEEGSPLAQTLFAVPGLAALTLDGGELTITREPDVEWHDLIEDVSDALRDFFL
jgi:hypothetical protein